MLRLEQLRAELIDRFERVDRRFAQQEQRIGRLDQRVADMAERLESLRSELLDRLAMLLQAFGSDARTAAHDENWPGDQLDG